MNAPASEKRSCHLVARVERGFSLIEIMVAMVAGLLLAAGIGQVFLSSKQSYRLQDQISRIQENGRYAIEMLTHDVRMAGSVGCKARSGMIENTLITPTSLYFNFHAAVDGFEADGTDSGQTYGISSGGSGWTRSSISGLPNVTPAITGIVIPGTDVLVLRGRVGTESALRAATPTDLALQPPLVSEAGQCSDDSDRINGLCAGDFAMVSDCSVTRIFQISAVAGDGTISHGAGGSAPGNTCGSWDQPAGVCRAYVFPTAPPAEDVTPRENSPAEISKLATTLYFIGRRDGNSGPSLYRRVVDESVERSNANQSQELVEGVETMQILYGVDLGGGSTRFLTAAEVGDWSTVRSVRVGLLMRTLDEVNATPDVASYSVNGTTIDPPDDRRLRRVVTTTISLRNLSP